MSNLAEVTKKRYDEFSRKWGISHLANGHTAFGLSLREKLYNTLFSHSEYDSLKKNPVAFLDSGCGNGFLMDLFLKHFSFSECDGIDFLEIKIEQARKKNIFSNLVCGDILNLEQHFNKTYDIVHSCGIYHYIDSNHRKQFWESHLHMLKPGGRMIFVEPNFQAVFRKIKPLRFGEPYNIKDVIDVIGQFSEYEIETIMGIDMAFRSILYFNPENISPILKLINFEWVIVIRKAAA